jgi:hypothetical protein
MNRCGAVLVSAHGGIGFTWNHERLAAALETATA